MMTCMVERALEVGLPVTKKCDRLVFQSQEDRREEKSKGEKGAVS